MNKLSANLNTALLTIVLALSSWTLKKVTDLSERQAAADVVDSYQTKEINEINRQLRRQSVNITSDH